MYVGTPADDATAIASRMRRALRKSIIKQIRIAALKAAAATAPKISPHLLDFLNFGLDKEDATAREEVLTSGCEAALPTKESWTTEGTQLRWEEKVDGSLSEFGTIIRRSEGAAAVLVKGAPTLPVAIKVILPDGELIHENGTPGELSAGIPADPFEWVLVWVSRWVSTWVPIWTTSGADRVRAGCRRAPPGRRIRSGLALRTGTGFERSIILSGLGVSDSFPRLYDWAPIGCQTGADMGSDLPQIGTHISTHVGTSIPGEPASDKSYQHGATQPPLVKESPAPRLEPTTRYKRRGCYVDTAARQMKPGPVNVGGDGVERCARYCGGMTNVPGSTIYGGGENATDAPYLLFAMQAANWCSCSNDWDITTQFGTVTDPPQAGVTKCTPCIAGNAGQPMSASDQANGLYCGGGMANYVYETPYPANHQYCPSGETGERTITQWRDCNPDDDHDNDADVVTPLADDG
eukprot:g19483.t1